MFVKINHQVKQALQEGKAVVALESTIITHGMPYPQNVNIALEVEQTVRKHGAIPATIGIINGDIIVGLSEEQIDELAKSNNVLKVSRQDFSYAVTQKKSGGTTVAATMIIAAMAKIKVFVTGGIGGVHRGVNESGDISTDLEELGRTNVAVVCAGPKAILDIPKTLEYLETKGVPVLGYNTDKMPMFYSISDHIDVPYRVNSALQIADIINAQHTLNLENGILIVNPIPKINAINIEKEIEKAILEAKINGIRGKEETPFLLAKLNELTKGRSLEANRALILNNAKLGAEIAASLQGVKQ